MSWDSGALKAPRGGLSTERKSINMTHEIIGLGDWLTSAAGQRVMAWERVQFHLALTDVFGFHAVQLGLPEMDCLGSSRMPHRWVLGNEADGSTDQPSFGVAAWADPAALPFPDASVDVVVLPHTLELCADPHGVLREVERVLVPEGRVVMTLFNPLSLWGGRQARAHLCERLGLTSWGALFLPSVGEFIAPWRLRDWLSLMNLQVQTQRYGVYTWPTQSPKWLERLEWRNRTGARWWPVAGAVYFVEATKRVRGMHLLGPVWRPHRRSTKPTAVAVSGSLSRCDCRAAQTYGERSR